MKNRADWLAGVKARLPGSYKRFEDILRDRRLDDGDRIELLGAWPAAGDFERGRIAMAVQELRFKRDRGTN